MKDDDSFYFEWQPMKLSMELNCKAESQFGLISVEVSQIDEIIQYVGCWGRPSTQEMIGKVVEILEMLL